MAQPPTSPSEPPSPPPGSAGGGERDDHIALPRPSFLALAEPLRHGGARGTDALREAGRAAGAALFLRLEEGATLSPDEFWDRIRRLAGPAGLGRPEYAVLAPGVASVTLADGAEARREDGGACHFATGWIAGLLSRAAGEPVAVMEVRCAALGPAEGCRFLVGSAARLGRVRRRLGRGEPLYRALAGDGSGGAGGDEP